MLMKMYITRARSNYGLLLCLRTLSVKLTSRVARSRRRYWLDEGVLWLLHADGVQSALWPVDVTVIGENQQPSGDTA